MARALVATRGDRARALALAREARAGFAGQGDQRAAEVAAWIARGGR